MMSKWELSGSERPNTVNHGLSAFLSETEPLLANIDELPPETTAELYEMYGIAAGTATENIANIDPEIRVTICGRQGEIVDRIAAFDLLPPEHSRERTYVYTPAVHNYRKWSNVELLKDKGIVGYLLAKEINAQPVMYFGTKQEDYSYLPLLPDMEVLYSGVPDGDEKAYFEHLNADYEKMDVLVLHGMYDQTKTFLDEYRKLRPDGKVYCGLDMNNWWMDRIDWDKPDVSKFANQCDIIATSCRKLRDALNRKREVHFPCYWIPNGFFDPTGVEVVAEPENKKNVIITVGRIGDGFKNNSELLIAFAGISEILPGWKLRLIGPIVPEFQLSIDNYFKMRPDLKNRVTFTGAITDKTELYKEYASAKIFALTSKQEGAPNVYAEALVHGCMFVTSDIDAADDITNYGELGYKYSIGNIDELSSTLVRACSNANKSAFKKHIPKALAYAAKHYDWNLNAKKLAYMLYN